MAHYGSKHGTYPDYDHDWRGELRSRIRESSLIMDDNEIPTEFVPSWIRVTDPNEKMPGGNKGGFISYRGVSPVDIDAKSVGQKFAMDGQDYTISKVWREGRAGEEVSLSFDEIKLEQSK
jgi:hypothetical protein